MAQSNDRDRRRESDEHGEPRRSSREKPGPKGASNQRVARQGSGPSGAAPGPPRSDAGHDLPRWVMEALTRVTRSERVSAALEALGEASAALNDGRFKAAVGHARKAKELSPRDATIREVLGLASYRLGDWVTALRELRTYRRLAGDPTHLPVEIDVLRAMGRDKDVEVAWGQLQRMEVTSDVAKEGIVIYASFLIDKGRLEEARSLVTPKALKNVPQPEDLRIWYVAARAAAVDGDPAEARRFRDAILAEDPAFPGIDELDSTISSTPR